MINCEDIATRMKSEAKKKIIGNERLLVIQIDNDAASSSYIKGKKKDCDEVGIICDHIQFSSPVTEDEIIETINVYNGWSDCRGIIVQMPIPSYLDKDKIISSISDEKDVDGFKPTSNFIPCTPKGILKVLDSIKFDVCGKICTVIGKSKIVGRPMIELLLDRSATVICCNSKTKNLSQFTLQSDIIISAVGKKNLIMKNMIRPYAVVIDVGINKDEYGKLCGDVSRECYDLYQNITPVPKGIGLLTRASLIENLVNGCEQI